MNYDYESFLYVAIARIINNLKSENKIPDLKFIVSEEQQYINDEKSPDTLYIVYKKTSSNLTYSINTEGYNIYILSEENQLEYAKMIGDEFSATYNYFVSYEGTTYAKHSYTNPVSLSNFNAFGYGVRSVIYISATLLILDDLLLLKSGEDGSLNKITVDNEVLDVIGFTPTYTMVPDTQQFSNYELSESEKSTASVGCSFSIALQNKPFIRKVLNIMRAELEGNSEFVFSFYIGDISFTYNMKLVNAQLSDSPDKAPSLNLNFMV